MSGRPLRADDILWVESYRTEVLNAFGAVFAEAVDRFAEGERLLRRFNSAVGAVLKGASFRAVDEAHYELCIARAANEYQAAIFVPGL